jgi:peptide methionine sulfoxide reductase MsrB
MRHTTDHDPIRDHGRCLVCGQGLSAAMAKMADMAGWPSNPATMVSKLRELALESIREAA